MIKQSNVAVVGTVVSAGFTRAFVESEGGETLVDRTLEVRVEVESVLHGQVADGADRVQVEFGPYSHEETTSDLWEALLGRRAVFVLRRQGAPVNLDPRRPDELARKTYRLVCSQGLLDDENGTTAVPMADPDQGFLQALEGRSFREVVAQVDAVD
ncbi:hypothetical protein [Nocardioides stalactiti]|uniref:hypothetical protein n=1 Tax=Nocardioides stalactiti TaxID=2755356 RepID=UPI001601FB63|nr:hypothetical protein [Nocardioides stalactiti]